MVVMELKEMINFDLSVSPAYCPLSMWYSHQTIPFFNCSLPGHGMCYRPYLICIKKHHYKVLGVTVSPGIKVDTCQILPALKARSFLCNFDKDYQRHGFKKCFWEADQISSDCNV